MIRETALLLLLPLAACGDTKDTDTDTTPDDTGDTGINPLSNAGFSWDDLVPAQGTLWTYRNATTRQQYTATIDAEAEIDGAMYVPFSIGDFTDDRADRYTVHIDFSTPFELGIKQMAWIPIGSDTPSEFYKMDPPLVFPLLDVEDTPTTTSSTAWIGAGGDVDVSVTTTLEHLDTSVDVPMGTVDNCREYKEEITVGGAAGFTVPIQVFFHADYKFVRSSDFIGGVQWELVSYIE